MPSRCVSTQGTPMPVDVNGLRMYRIGEALTTAGLSRATYFRWIKEGKVADARFRDRNGRRILTPDEVRALFRATHEVIEAEPSVQTQMRLEVDPLING